MFLYFTKQYSYVYDIKQVYKHESIKTVENLTKGNITFY